MVWSCYYRSWDTRKNGGVGMAGSRIAGVVAALKSGDGEIPQRQYDPYTLALFIYPSGKFINKINTLILSFLEAVAEVAI